MIVASSVIVLTGCSGGTGTSSEPVQSSPPQATSPIPPVKNPRDVAAIARRTCDLLTPQQAKEFRLDDLPKPSDGLFSTTYCVWSSTSRDGSNVRRLSIGVMTNNPTLEVAYNRYRNRPSFELIELSGYPALVSRSNADLPSCDIDIKLAERQSVSLTYDSKEFNSNLQQSCEVAKQVAAAVVMNVPPKS